MKQISLDFDRTLFLRYCTDPVYLAILNMYFDYIEENLVMPSGKSFYDALYQHSSFDPLLRVKLLQNNGTLESIKRVAQDFGVQIEYSFRDSFVLGESHLNSNDALKNSFFKENVIRVTQYDDYYKLCEFESFFNKNMKAAGIKTTLQVSV